MDEDHALAQGEELGDLLVLGELVAEGDVADPLVALTLHVERRPDPGLDRAPFEGRECIKQRTKEFLLRARAVRAALHRHDPTAKPLDMAPPGVVILTATDLETAKAIMNGDPAVQAGVFKARLNRFVLSFMQGRS